MLGPDQRAVEVVDPGVVRALEADRRPARLLDDRGPPMPAHVVEAAQSPRFIANNQDRLPRQVLGREVDGVGRDLVALAVADAEPMTGQTLALAKVLAWEKANAAAIARARNSMVDFEESRSDLAVLSVMLRQIRTLANTAAA